MDLQSKFYHTILRNHIQQEHIIHIVSLGNNLNHCLSSNDDLTTYRNYTMNHHCEIMII